MRKTIIPLVLISIFIAGCVSIPPETSELSVELGNRISALESSNITLLHNYFAEKRNAIDEFITSEWSPRFTQNFFSDSGVSKALEEILAGNDQNQKIEFMQKAGAAIQKQINNKRLELIQPIDDLERKIELKIREEYSVVYAINNSITSFLLSASELAENRDRYLKMIGVTNEKITKVIDMADGAVSEMLTKVGDFEKSVEAAETYKRKIEMLINSL